MQVFISNEWERVRPGVLRRLRECGLAVETETELRGWTEPAELVLASPALRVTTTIERGITYTQVAPAGGGEPSEFHLLMRLLGDSSPAWLAPWELPRGQYLARVSDALLAHYDALVAALAPAAYEETRRRLLALREAPPGKQD